MIYDIMIYIMILFKITRVTVLLRLFYSPSFLSLTLSHFKGRLFINYNYYVCLVIYNPKIFLKKHRVIKSLIWFFIFDHYNSVSL